MQAATKHIQAIETDAGEIFRCGDYITVSCGDREFCGRLDFVGGDYFTVDASTPYRADTRNFEYPQVADINRADPPVAGYPVYFFHCNALLRPHDMEKVRVKLLEQIDEGVVILPRHIEFVRQAQGCGDSPQVEFIKEGTEHDNH